MLRNILPKKPELKQPADIAHMREAGKIVAEALRLARGMCQPGTRTADIDKAIDELFARHGATPLFKGYAGKTPWTRAHRRWISQLKLPNRAQQVAFEEYVQAVHEATLRVERLINRCKQFRRLATRYEKLAENYRAMWVIAVILLWL